MSYAAFQITVTDDNGNIVPGAYIRVQREEAGAPLAVLFEDRDGLSTLSNPAIADDQGFLRFHVSGGAYQITAFDLAATFSRSWRYVAIGTYSEYDYGTAFLPQGPWSAATIYDVGALVSHKTTGANYAFASNHDNNVNNAPNATTPASDSHWTIIGMLEGVGAPGAPGAVGPAGPNLGLDYHFIAAAAPVPGYIGTNNADPTLVTQIALHTIDANGTDNSAFIANQGHSTGTPRGSITIVDVNDRANWLALDLLSTFTAGVATVAYVAHAGELDGTRVGILFVDNGDRGIDGEDGTDGAPGAPGAPGPGGDVVGPTSTIANRIAVFANTTGKLLKETANTENALLHGGLSVRHLAAPSPGGFGGDLISLGGTTPISVLWGTGTPTVAAGAGSLFLSGGAAGSAHIATAINTWAQLLTAGITDLQFFTATATLLLRDALRDALDDAEFTPTPLDLTIEPLASLSGNITVGPTTRKLLLIGQAAGGAGGGCTSASSTGGGAGAAGETRAAIVTVTPAQVIPFVIGAEGMPGAAGASTGGTGADLTIGAAGAIMTCKGGVGGTGAGGGAIGASGGTPTGSGGIRIPPAGLATTWGSSTMISQGGSCWFGNGGMLVVGASWPGQGALGPGGGGSGGMNGSGTTARAGGQGGVGQILLIGFGG